MKLCQTSRTPASLLSPLSAAAAAVAAAATPSSSLPLPEAPSPFQLECTTFSWANVPSPYWPQAAFLLRRMSQGQNEITKEESGTIQAPWEVQTLFLAFPTSLSLSGSTVPSPFSHAGVQVNWSTIFA